MLFFGKLHPLIVHLPIGALLLATLLDVAGYFFDKELFRRAVKVSLWIGCISAIVACILGYLLSLSVGYDVEVLDQHIYSGIAVAVVSGALCLITVQPKVFTALLLSMGCLLAYAGHQGGNLTYGSDYFSQQEKIDSVFLPVNEFDTIDMRPIEALRNKGVMVRIMLKRPLMLDVTITPGIEINLDELKAVAPNIIMFNIANNNLHDIAFVRDFVNLEKLRLEKNPVDDKIINDLISLKHLVAVNLNETNVTPAGIKKLRTNSSIQRVYTWHTKVE